MDGVLEIAWLVLTWGPGYYPLWSSFGDRASGSGSVCGLASGLLLLGDSRSYSVAGSGDAHSLCWGEHSGTESH